MISISIILSFLLMAILYSSIGFGGGSSYIAILFIAEIPFEHIPIMALICNLIVVTGSSLRYIKNSLVNWKFLAPFLIASIPFSYFAGSLEVDKNLLKSILGLCLMASAIRMIFNKKTSYADSSLPPYIASISLGSGLGFLSGLVGIGGGIFLSPILYNLKWGRPKQISAICCLFIFFNSIAGFIGQLSKLSSSNITAEFFSQYWPLTLAVFLGGQLGSFIGVTKLKPRWIELITAILVFFVSIRILF